VEGTINQAEVFDVLERARAGAGVVDESNVQGSFLQRVQNDVARDEASERRKHGLKTPLSSFPRLDQPCLLRDTVLFVAIHTSEHCMRDGILNNDSPDLSPVTG
jgi:hypothetical protein